MRKIGDIAALSLVACLCLVAPALRANDNVPAEKEIRAGVAKALPLLEKGAVGHRTQRTCFACHNQAIPIFALTTARSRGFAIDEKELGEQLDFIAKFLDRNSEKYKMGKGQGGQVDTAGYALWTLEAGGRKADGITDAVTDYLLQFNKDIDHWRTSSSRPPSEASQFTSNYLGLRALKVFGRAEQKEAIAARVAVVKKWLSKTPAKDTEDHVFRLRAWQWVEDGATELKSAADALMKLQRDDGAWAQNDKMQPDAYATASALVALHDAGGISVHDPVYRHGLKYLLSTQKEDGSWHVVSRSKPFQTYFETGFPHGKDQFISSAASAWAATALALALPIAQKTQEQSISVGNISISEKHIMVPMRDGVKLSTYLYTPPGQGPWPVLYEQRYADLRGKETRQGYARLAAAGYVVAAQSFRGAQLSEGTWVGYRALAWGEKQDGFDTVEWLAKQPWSTGKIGTLGSSQGGFAQNFLAVAAPPHLVCQYMIDTGLSLFHEGYRIGGTVRPLRFKEMDKVCRVPEHNQALVQEWFRHPTYDDYWAAEDCTPHFGKMNVPCLTIGSYYDFMIVGSVESYIGRQHRGGPNSKGKQQLVLGPWLHGRNKNTNKTGELVYPENAKFDQEASMLRWFDYHLKGIKNGVDRDPAVRYYAMGAAGEKDVPGNVWRQSADWPVKTQSTPYYLREGGIVSPDAPTAKKSRTMFQADPQHPNEIPGRGFPGARDARAFEKQKDVRTFTSPVLTEPVEWTGKVQVELYVSSDAPDTDFIVRISDVYPDGRSMLLMDYVRRARYREGYDKEVRLEPGKVAKVAFDVGWTSQVFAKGHQIRVTIASTGAPFYEVNPNTGEPFTTEPAAKSRIANNALHHDALHASRILAPVKR